MKPYKPDSLHKKIRTVYTVRFPTGNNLSSRAASSQVLSTRESLTTVFGMGTGGSSQPSSPDPKRAFSFPAASLLHLTRSIYSGIIFASLVRSS